jgi:hypothetical protein
MSSLERTSDEEISASVNASPTPVDERSFSAVLRQLVPLKRTLSVVLIVVGSRGLHGVGPGSTNNIRVRVGPSSTRGEASM